MQPVSLSLRLFVQHFGPKKHLNNACQDCFEISQYFVPLFSSVIKLKLPLEQQLIYEPQGDPGLSVYFVPLQLL